MSNSVFNGKVVWITGASSGIGEAMARDFVKRGARVILTARRVDRLNALADSLGTSAKVLPADLGDLSALPALAAKALNLFGQVDVLFNNAGFSQRSLAMDTSFELEKKVVDVDLLSPIALTKAILPHMKARGSGRVLVTSSLMGYLEIPGNATYACVKHGLNGYFYSLAYEVRPLGIEVQILEPGFVKTEVTLNAVTASGAQYGKMDSTHANAMSAEEFSRRAFKQLEKGKAEIIVAGWEHAALYVRWWFPCLYRWAVHKYARVLLKERF